MSLSFCPQQHEGERGTSTWSFKQVFLILKLGEKGLSAATLNS